MRPFLLAVLFGLPEVAYAGGAAETSADALRLVEVARHRFAKGNEVQSVAFRADGKRLLVGTEHELVEWSTASKAAPTVLAAPRDGGRFALSADGSLLAVHGEKNVVVWDLATSTAKATLWPTGALGELQFSPDATVLASGDYEPEQRGAVTLGAVDGHGKSTRFHVLTGKADYDSGNVVSLAFSADGSRLAVLAVNDTPPAAQLEVWTLSPKRKRRVLSIGKIPWVNASIVAPATGHAVAFVGDRVLAAFYGGAGLWETSDAEAVRTYAFEGDVTSMAVSPTGDLVAVAGHDHEVRVWNVESGALVAVSKPLEGQTPAIAFAADGKRIAAGVGETAIVWTLP